MEKLLLWEQSLVRKFKQRQKNYFWSTDLRHFPYLLLLIEWKLIIGKKKFLANSLVFTAKISLLNKCLRPSGYGRRLMFQRL